MAAPICPACQTEAVLRLGADAGLDAERLADAPIWICTFCPDTWAECRSGTEEPIGPLADPGLRESREVLRQRRIDPLWQCTDHQPLARGRVYSFLAHRMGLAEADPAAFDLEQCRAAWLALKGVTYADVRAWATTHRGLANPRRAAP